MHSAFSITLSVCVCVCVCVLWSTPRLQVSCLRESLLVPGCDQYLLAIKSQVSVLFPCPPFPANLHMLHICIGFHLLTFVVYFVSNFGNFGNFLCFLQILHIFPLLFFDCFFFLKNAQEICFCQNPQTARNRSFCSLTNFAL